MSISGSDSLAADPSGCQGMRRLSEGLHAAHFIEVKAAQFEIEGKGHVAH